MKNPILRSALALSLVASAGAQVSSEGFEAGNPDGWEMWFNVYNSVEAVGGNPGAFLRLDNVTSGPAACHYVEIFPDGAAAPFLHSGDWSAAGVDSVSIDLNVEQGLFVGDVILELTSDPGTPGDPTDDCIISLALVAAGPAAAGWNTYSFDVPASQVTMPLEWEIESTSACAFAPRDQVWVDVLRDVDQMRVIYDGNPPAFCVFTNWIMGADNLSVNSSGPPTIGSRYCMANANSTGVAAAISAVGSALISDNSVTLQCTSMPMNSFAYLIASQAEGFVANPAGSSGNLCLSGQIGRFVGPGQIQNSGAGGEIDLALDLNQMPTPMGFVPVQSGETWSFSTWFRDTSPAGPTSNFSNGCSILFL